VISKSFKLAPGILTEKIGEDVLVFADKSGQVLKVSGPVKAIIEQAHLGAPIRSAEANVVQELVNRGILVPTGGVSRRSALKAGVVWAGASVATLSLPGVAAASSDELTGIPIEGTYEIYFFRASQAAISPLLVNPPLDRWAVEFVVPSFNLPPDLGFDFRFDFPEDLDTLTPLTVRGLGTVPPGFARGDLFNEADPSTTDFVSWIYFPENTSGAPDFTDPLLSPSVLESYFDTKNQKQGTFTWGEQYLGTFTFYLVRQEHLFN